MTLPDIVELLAARSSERAELTRRHLNSQYLNTLESVGLKIAFTRGQGPYLYDEEGRRYLDLVAGSGTFLLGRNHPEVKTAITRALAADLPSLVLPTPALVPGLVAELLAERAPWLQKTYFCNSGSEAVEAALKFARRVSGRQKIIYCEGAFHGMSYGALSVNGIEEFRAGFGEPLPGAHAIPFGDAQALAEALDGDEAAAFIFEPIQGFGVNETSPAFWTEAQRLCRAHGTLMIADEVQTGGCRTGRFFGFEHYGLEPDLVTLSKSLTGGMIPVGALMCRAEIYERIYSSRSMHTPHWSTCSENLLAMVAALSSLQIMARDDLAARAEALGLRFRRRLQASHERFNLVTDLRGKGLMIGVGLTPQPGPLRLLMSLLLKHRINVSTSAPRWDALKLLPPLTIDDAVVDEFCDALDSVLENEDI